MTRYVMVADLERCVGCQTCTAACRHSNATSPAVQWRRVLDIEAGAFPNVRRTFVPVGCQHCAEPPCMDVCPTTATRKRPDGIVTVDYDACIGCAYCEVACPYQARFKVDQPHFAFESISASEAARADPRRIGVSQKCTFCSDRIDDGLAKGLVPGVDPAATPACVNACIASALQFGDVHDPCSPVARLLAENAGFRMHEELGTAPGFYYLQDHRHVKETSAPDPTAAVRGVDIEPVHQRHWNWKAAANFLCGGAGSVLFVASVIAGDRMPALAALMLMALGLLILFFKIGRPLRFLYVFRQPRRSWMSREAWIAALMFPLGGLYVLTGSVAVGGMAALLAAAFLFAQAMILKEARGVPAWRSRAIVPLVLTTAAVEGIALYSMWSPLFVLGALLVVIRFLAWLRYSADLRRQGGPARMFDVLNALSAWMLWFGTVLPTGLLGLAVMVNAPFTTVLAALVMLGGGWVLKFLLITRAGYQQGYALKLGAIFVRPGWSDGTGTTAATNDGARAPILP